jgi:hypothetical protein
MRFLHGLLLVGILVGLGPILGCGESSEGMKNMKPGTGPAYEMEIKNKNGTAKPLGAEPASPQAPPLTKR